MPLEGWEPFPLLVCHSLGSASCLRSCLLSAGEWPGIVLRGKAEGAQEDRGGAQVLVDSSPVTFPAPPPPPGRCPVPCLWPVRVWSIPLNFMLTRNASFVLVLWGFKGVPPQLSSYCPYKRATRDPPRGNVSDIWAVHGKIPLWACDGGWGAEETLKGRAKVGVHYGCC